MNRSVTILDATLREGEQTPGVCFGAHIKAGVHTQAALVDPLHYQSLDPALFGRESWVALDHMSGLSSVRHALGLIGEDDTDFELAETVLEQVKSIGQIGRIVDLDELALIVGWLDRRARVPAAGGLS